MPYCWTVLAVNNTMPQMTLTTTGLPRHFGMATVIPLPSVTVGHSFDSRRRRSCSAMPRRRNHSNGINDSAPNVNRVAPKNSGLMESMPCTCDTNAKPQIMAVRTRQAMPPISFLCMSHYPIARFSPTEKPDHILVRLLFDGFSAEDVAGFFSRDRRRAGEYTGTCSRSPDTGSARRGWRSS